MKWNCRKWTAFTLAIAMTMISTLPVSAETEEVNDTGIGRLEGNVRTDIYQVMLPTVSSHTFDFIIDPLELINKTGGAGYGGKTFEKDSTLFFRRTDKGKKEDYSSTSNPITITNRGSIPVDVSLKVWMDSASLEGIRMTEDKAFTGDNGTSLYMAVLNGDQVMPIGTDGVSIHTTLEAAPGEAFEYGYDKEKKKYTYKLKGGLSESVFSTQAFQIVGAANGEGDWSKLTDVSPQIKIAWEITQKADITD